MTRQGFYFTKVVREGLSVKATVQQKLDHVKEQAMWVTAEVL